MIYVIYAFYISVFQANDFKPKENGLTFREFALFQYFGRKAEWIDLLFKLPISFKHFTNYMGTFFTPAISFAGIVSTIMWLLINYTENYYSTYHSASVIYSILIVGAIIIMFSKSRRMYAVYKVKQ